MTVCAFLSPTAAAAELSCSRDTILRAIERGDLPAFKDGRVVRIPREAFDGWIASRMTTSRSLRRAS